METSSASHGAVVVLDVGGGTGALVVHVPEALLDHELEISPADTPRSRTHTLARRRHLPHGTVVAAVFPSLPEGDHTVWGPSGEPMARVHVTSGGVTEVTCAGTR